MENYEVVVRCGEEELLVDYPKILFDEDSKPTFSDRNDLFQIVGEAVEKCLCEMKKKFMKTITLSEFKGLSGRPENVGDLSFLNEKKKQLVCGVGDVVFLMERTADDVLMVVQRLIVEDV